MYSMQLDQYLCVQYGYCICRVKFLSIYHFCNSKAKMPLFLLSALVE